MKKANRMGRRMIALAIATIMLAMFGTHFASAQEAAVPETATEAAVSASVGFTLLDNTSPNVMIDTTWVMLTGFLVFFMQTGFAMLEAGLVRQQSVVNALLENFIDAGLTAICWWLVGFGIAFGASSGGIIGTSLFAPGMEYMNVPYGVQVNPAYGIELNISVLTMFFFQFAFAATASTITTGAMAERTDFVGDLIYSALIALFIYPVIVHWVWGGGWLGAMGFHDFAGSNVVHTVGGVIALVGAIMLGPRKGKVWGQPVRPHNLGLATIGTMILWFGWYGFNPGSTLGVVGYSGLIGLVTLNTTLGAAAGALAALFFTFARTGKWDLVAAMNGTLAGLVAITAGCAFVSPLAAILIGLPAGILFILAGDVVEKMKVDDAVGAFAVHGVCGITGILAIGLWADPSLTYVGAMAGNAGLLMGGGLDLLGVQAVGSLSTIAYVTVTSVIMFGALKAINRLRVNAKGDEIGIDVYEHGASLWPDVLPYPGEEPVTVRSTGPRAAAPAVGD